MSDMTGPDHHAEMEAHYASGQHRQDAQHAADIVCHTEQMIVWTDEIVSCLALGDYLREDLSYDDKISINAKIDREIRRIIESAFSHPALAPRLGATDMGAL